MHGPENWHCGLAPHIEIEIRQAELDVLYARQNEAERRARFEEAPTPVSAETEEELCDE